MALDAESSTPVDIRQRVPSGIRRNPFQGFGDIIERLADVPIADFNPTTLVDEKGGFRLGHLLPVLGATAMARRSWKKRQTTERATS